MKAVPGASFSLFFLVSVVYAALAIRFISHRGESLDAPEIRLAAFPLAASANLMHRWSRPYIP